MVKLADFGIAAELFEGDEMTYSGTSVFKAPEHTLHIISERVDVWAVGVALFKIISKDYPFKKEDVEELKKT